MKTIHDPATREEILRRIHSLTPGSQRQWGEMTVEQAVVHLTDPLRDAIGERDIKPVVPRIIQPLFRRMLLSEKPFAKNAPTLKPYNQKKGTGTRPRGLEQDRQLLLQTIDKFVAYGPAEYRPHAGLGSITREQWGQLMYKHLDHHLRQFSA